MLPAAAARATFLAKLEVEEARQHVKPKVLDHRRRGGHPLLAEDDLRVRGLRLPAGRQRPGRPQDRRARGPRPRLPRHQDAADGRAGGAEGSSRPRGLAAGGHPLRPRHRARPRSRPPSSGAFDFIEKPPESDRILLVARNALAQRRSGEKGRLRKLSFDERYRMVGESPALEKVRDAIRRAAPTNATVLITGRERGGQGAGRARHPPQQPAQGRGVRAGQLRGHPRGADRERAVRPREGLVHGRHREADRQVRAGPQGHDLPGRGRRHEPAHAGQGPARAAGGRGRAHRLAEDDPGGRARDRRHQQEPGGGDREGRVPRGPLLPALRHPHPRAAAARAQRGRPAARRALRAGSSRPRTTSSRKTFAPAAMETLRSATPGAATCASCATRSSAC